MRNPDLPKLLRAIGNSPAAYGGQQIIYEQAAVELEKLEKIYKLIEDKKIQHSSVLLDHVKEILNGR